MDYKIVFKTEQQGDGAKKTVEELKQIEAQANQTKAALDKLTPAGSGKSAADSAGVFTKDARAKQDSADTAQAMSDMTREAKAAEPALKKLDATKRDFVATIKQLKHHIPGAGLALTLLKSPIAALVGVIAALVVSVWRKVEALREAEKASLALGTSIDKTRNSIANTTTDMNAAADAAHEYAEKLKEIAEANSNTEATATKETRALDRQAATEENIAKARLELQKSQVDESVASGKISPEAGRRSKRGLELAFETDQAGRAATLTDRKQDVLSKAAFAKENEARAAEALIPAAEAAAADAERKAKLAAKKRPELKAEIEKRRKEAEAEKEKLEQEDAGLGVLGGYLDQIPGAYMGGKGPLQKAHDESQPWRHHQIQKLDAEMKSLDAVADAQDSAIENASANARRARGFVGKLQGRSSAARTGQSAFESTEAGMEADAQAAARGQAAVRPLEAARGRVEDGIDLKAEFDRLFEKEQRTDKAVLDYIKKKNDEVEKFHGTVEANTRREH